MGIEMKAQFIKTFFIFTGFLFLLFICYTLALQSSTGKENTENVTVLLNEIEQLTTKKTAAILQRRRLTDCRKR